MIGIAGCDCRGGGGPELPDIDAGPRRDGGGDAGLVGPIDAGPRPPDAGPPDAHVSVDPDAACAAATVEAMVERVPVDIVFVIDNSASMGPAIDFVQSGINGFADRIAASGIDYRVILLSLRGMGRVTVGGSTRYAICVPPPLAGASCADGARFFQVEMDVRSTQPVEQVLGTLAQTAGYLVTDSVGSAPWRDLLRDGTSKTIVFITDDNARTCDRTTLTCASTDPPLTVTSLEDFPGGGNPFNFRTLGPGLLTATYGELFRGYKVDAIYGWGSETDPDVTCTFPGGATPSAAGHTYTELVRRTGGVRAKICDGPSAWGPFFDAVASDVVRSTPIACDIALPPPPDGMTLDPRRVNVEIRGSAGTTVIPYVGSAAACDPMRGGWYYDDERAPTRVILCPASCDFARMDTSTAGGGVDVVFGCASILI